jgi:hypothetical protein
MMFRPHLEAGTDRASCFETHTPEPTGSGVRSSASG